MNTKKMNEALKLLTHDEAVPYMDYVRNIKNSGNKAAIAVKKADLIHNSDTWRLVTLDEKAMARLEKYKADHIVQRLHEVRPILEKHWKL